MSALQLTKELVSFASPSHVSNREVSQFIADQLTERGFDLELTEYTDAQGVEKVNVAGRKGPTGGGAGLAYFCHSDVVPAETWTGPGEPFDATEQDGRLYGRGSCDMKGSAACMLEAITRLADTALTSPLYFVCTADEEVSYVGAKHFVTKSQIYREMVERQTRALIGEPTELEVVYAHKGICKWIVVSHGEEAHSSSRAGLNANLAMIPFLQEVKDLYDETESAPKFHNAEFDPPGVSLNIGINDNTKATNVKPAKSVCTLFYRPVPGIDEKLIMNRIEEAAKRNGLECTLHSKCDPVYTQPDSEFVVDAVKLSGTEAARTVAYGTDAGELKELQHKIVCGPGCIAQAHTVDEWMALSQFEKGTDRFEQFVRRWCV